MPNMDPKKCPMPSQEPNVRNKNFKEVALGYTEEMAVNEAKRCLQCKNHPCRSGCPVEIDIPGFIKHVAEGEAQADQLLVGDGFLRVDELLHVLLLARDGAKLTRALLNQPASVPRQPTRFRAPCPVPSGNATPAQAP